MRAFKRKTRDDARLWADLRAYAEREGLAVDDLAGVEGVTPADAVAILTPEGERPRSAAMTTLAGAWGVRMHRADAERYTVEFHDQKHSLTRRLTGYTSKAATIDLGRRCEELSAYAAQRQQPTAELRRWLESLPGKTQERLLSFGLIDAQRFAGSKPIGDHVEDYHADLVMRGVSGRVADIAKKRLATVFTTGRMVFWSDITTDRLRTAIDRMKRGKKPIGIQTRNHYITIAKSFANWMVETGRADRSPLASMKKQTVTDARERRAASVNELRRLIHAAEAGEPWRWGAGKGGTEHTHAITGPERALLYRLAVETGLRRGELAALTRGSFELDTAPPRVRVASAYTKNKREAVIPLRSETAEAIADHVAYMMPHESILSVPSDTARMIDADLLAAGIDKVDAQGRRLDFHALRHTFITNIANSGAPVKVIQELARHSTPTLTIGRYAHADDQQRNTAIASLPTLQTLSAAAVGCGTHGGGPKSGGFSICPPCGPELSAQGRRSATRRDSNGPDASHAQVTENHTFSLENKGKNAKPPTGLEPVTCGLQNRCSAN